MASSLLVATPPDMPMQRVDEFTPFQRQASELVPFTSRNVSDQENQILVRVLLDGEEQDHVLPIQPGETIGSLRLRLANKPWLTGKHCLFYGGNELLENQQVASIAALANDADDKYLHVFVSAADVHHVQVTTGDFAPRQRALSFGSLSFGNGAAPLPAPHGPSRRPVRSPSMLTASLQANVLGDVAEDSECLPDLLAPPDVVLPDLTPAAAALKRSVSSPVIAKDAAAAAVIHLIIRKTAHFAWHAVGTGEFELEVKTSETPEQLCRRIDPDGGSRHSTLTFNGIALEADKPLSEYGISVGDVLELVPYEPSRARSHPGSYADGTPRLSSPSHDLFFKWQRANSGLRAGMPPNLAPTGTGGSYFMRDADNVIVAVFKPADEEPHARNNPRGFTGGFTSSSAPASFSGSGSCSGGSGGGGDGSGAGLRRGIEPGSGARREVAAYVLDHGHRAGVPATAIVFVPFKDKTCKFGSLQDFVPSQSDCEDMGPGFFSFQEVQKIALLDIRLANTDRNGGNILVSKRDGEYVLTPIDHGCCLPDSLEDITFQWSYWPQAKVPFTEEAREYIQNLDPDADLQLLIDRDLELPPACARIFKACNVLLKKVAVLGLAPYHAAIIMQRSGFQKSPLEKLHREACVAAVREEEFEVLEEGQLALVTVRKPGFREPKSDAKYLHHLSELLDTFLEEFVLELDQ